MWLMRVKENHKGEIVWDSRQWAGRHSRQVTLDANRICKHYISHPSLSHEFCIKLGKAETMRPKFSIWFMLCFIWYRSRYPQIALLTPFVLCCIWYLVLRTFIILKAWNQTLGTEKDWGKITYFIRNDKNNKVSIRNWSSIKQLAIVTFHFSTASCKTSFPTV